MTQSSKSDVNGFLHITHCCYPLVSIFSRCIIHKCQNSRAEFNAFFIRPSPGKKLCTLTRTPSYETHLYGNSWFAPLYWHSLNFDEFHKRKSSRLLVLVCFLNWTLSEGNLLLFLPLHIFHANYSNPCRNTTTDRKIWMHALVIFLCLFASLACK